ncbi:Aspartyl-phosphate phosphatase YisI [Bacillus licheniformis]|nr:Aspartyl-phosphate phosphatase YisI [Bacillus licheniformis]
MMNNKIEAKRLALFEAAEKFGINSKEAIQCSQELDNLLNQRMQKDDSCVHVEERKGRHTS